MIGFLGRRRGIASEFLTTWGMTRANISRFMSFYHHIDNFRSDRFLWLTAAGLAAAAPGPAKGELKRKIDPDETDDELPDAKGEEG